MSRNTINMHIMQWLYKKVPLITLQGIIIYRCASLPLKVPPCQNQIAFSLKYTRSWANKLCNRTSQQAKTSCNKYLSTHYKLCKTGIWRLLQFFFFFPLFSSPTEFQWSFRQASTYIHTQQFCCSLQDRYQSIFFFFLNDYFVLLHKAWMFTEAKTILIKSLKDNSGFVSFAQQPLCPSLLFAISVISPLTAASDLSFSLKIHHS